MRRSFIFAVSILIVLFIAIIAWWTSLVPKGSPTKPEPAQIASVETPRPKIPTAPAAHTRPRHLGQTNATPTSSPPANPLEPAPEQAAWEKEVDDILLSETDETQKSERLLAMLPKLDEDAQVEVAQHVVNLVPDEAYAHASQVLTNAMTPEPVLSVLMTDLLNRGNELKLPIILNLARTDKHPLQAESKELLEIYLQEDLGNDWGAWEKSLDNWLKENRTEN